MGSFCGSRVRGSPGWMVCWGVVLSHFVEHGFFLVMAGIQGDCIDSAALGVLFFLGICGIF